MQWLKYLANRYDGTFHEPVLSMDDEDDESDDDEVQELCVKSQTTLIRERHDRAVAAGAVISLTTTAGSSMRSTFHSISSSVTAMRNGGSSRLVERRVVLKDTSPMIKFDATRMVLDESQGKILVPSGEKIDGRKVEVSLHPFAQGGLRNVYHMKQWGEPRQVAKESRYDTKYQERLRFHIETSSCQARASYYAHQFNKQAKKKGIPKIDVLRAEVIRLRAPACPGGFRYLAVEKALKGTYQKWNGNNGYVNPSDCLECQVAQAFR